MYAKFDHNIPCGSKVINIFHLLLTDDQLDRQTDSHGDYMGLDARKPVFGGLRITQAQTSLRIRAVCLAPLLFAFWKVLYVNLRQVEFQFSS